MATVLLVPSSLLTILLVIILVLTSPSTTLSNLLDAPPKTQILTPNIIITTLLAPSTNYSHDVNYEDLKHDQLLKDFQSPRKLKLDGVNAPPLNDNKSDNHKSIIFKLMFWIGIVATVLVLAFIVLLWYWGYGIEYECLRCCI